MVAITALDTPTNTGRFEGGFDHYDVDARPGWTIIWRGAERDRCIMDDKGVIWAWDQRGRVWLPMSHAQENAALADHNCAMNRLRRALLTVRSLDSDIEAERDAARLALQRIATALVEEWYNRDGVATVRWADGWFDHPAALYLAVTRDCRNFFPENQRIPFEARTFSQLVAHAHQDYAARRRAQPPRLRPDDMKLLQTRLDQPAAPVAEDMSQPDRGAFVTTLREQLAASMVAEDQDEVARQRRRRQMMLMGVGSGVLALLLVAVGSVIGMS